MTSIINKAVVFLHDMYDSMRRSLPFVMVYFAALAVICIAMSLAKK